LLSLWRRHPEWPLLTVVQDADGGAAHGGAAHAGAVDAAAANILYHRGFLSDETLRALQNSHRFHLCTSEAEGWGHYIVEAMSVAAVTLTCDAAPMNELITAERGVLIAGRVGERHNMATLYQFDEPALEADIARLLTMAPAQWDQLGAAARAWFLDNKHGFVARVQHALTELGAFGHAGRDRP
jgi:hypothetical protein